MGAQHSGFSSPWGCLEVTGGVTGRASSRTLALVFQTTSRCLHSPKSLGFPRTGVAHPQLQGHRFCVVHHRHLRSDPPTFPLSLVLLPLQTRAASALFSPARTRPYPTFSDNTAGNGPSLEAGGHGEHATGICEHLLCTDTVQGPRNTAVDETEECLLSHPSREDRRKTDTTEEVFGVSDEAQCPGGKTKWGRAAGCQRRGEGVKRGGQSSQNKSQRGTRVAGAGGTVLSSGFPFP